MRARGAITLLGTVATIAAVLVCGSGSAAARPFHILVPHQFPQPPTIAQCEAAEAIACYGPAQFQQAYNMKPLYRVGLTGRGETIVIVDSFGSPTIQNDLATFDQAYGLPAPPSLRIIQPAGSVPPFDPTDSDMVGWAEETSLDVEYSHAMAPGANILLVETPVSETEGTVGFPQIVKAENFVINHNLGDVISQSFGATEQTFPSAQSIFALRGAYLNAAAHDVTVLGASGDGGATDSTTDLTDYYPFRVNSWPSSDPLVTSVGGSQLHLDANGLRTAPDNVWNDSFNPNVADPTPSPIAGGGGVSTVFSRPFYQNGVAGTVGRSRGTPDVSMSAAVDGGALVYMSFDPMPPAYYIFGGTSEASPLFSGVVAIADQAAGHRLGLLNPSLYALGDQGRSGLTDITSGNNSVAGTNVTQFPGPFSVTGFDASPGYDLSSGLGTPNGTRLVSQLSESGRFFDRRR
jgi:subtilase family serine protease